MELIPPFFISAYLLLLAGLALAIWFEGIMLSHLGDAISDRTGAGQALMGLISFAAITELPKLVMTVTAAHAGLR